MFYLPFLYDLEWPTANCLCVVTMFRLSLNGGFLSDHFPSVYSVTIIAFIVGMWMNLCRLHHHCRNASVQVLKNTKKLRLMFVFQNVCQTLWCSVKGSCRSKLDAAADGTQCGEKKVRCQGGARLRKVGIRGLHSWAELERSCFGVNGDHHTVRKDSTSTTLLEPSLGTGN